jgi:hypothetical protein
MMYPDRELGTGASGASDVPFVSDAAAERATRQNIAASPTWRSRVEKCEWDMGIEPPERRFV